MVEAENTIVLKSLEKARDSTERIKVLEEEKSALFLALRMAKGNNVLLYITGVRYFTCKLFCILCILFYLFISIFYNIYIFLSKL
jgi:hypothetical protein